MAIDASSLPAVDPDSYDRYRSKQLSDFADTALQQAVTPAPTPTPTPEPPPQPSPEPASTPVPTPDAQGGEPAPTPVSDATAPAPTPPEPQTEPTPEAPPTTPKDLPDWVPPSAKVVVASSAASQAGAPANALAWARANMGRSDFINWCEKFVENAYGTTGKYSSAVAAADAYQQQGRLRTDFANMAPGDLVYYGGAQENGGYGHAALAASSNSVVSSASAKPTPLSGYFRAPLLGYVPMGGDSKAPQPQPEPTPTPGNLDLPPVDVDSANAHQSQSLQQFASDRLTQALGVVKDAVGQVGSGVAAAVQQPAQSLQEWVQDRLAQGGQASNAVGSGVKESLDTLAATSDLATGAPSAGALLDLPGKIVTNVASRLTGAQGSPSLPPDTIAPGQHETGYESTGLSKVFGLGGVVEQAANPLTYLPIPGAAEAKEASAAIDLARQLRDIPSMAGAAGPALADTLRGSDPALAKVVDGFNGAPAEVGAKARLQQLGDTMQRLFIDDKAPINALGPQAEEAAANYAGRAGSAWQDVEEKLGPVYDALGANKGQNQEVVDGLNAYVGLQRYLEVAREKGSLTGGVDALGSAILKRKGPGGIATTADAQGFLAKLQTAMGPDNWAKIQQADALRQDAMHSLLQEKVQTGFLTQATADDLEKLYPHYNPVTVMQAINESPGAISGKALTQVGNTIKRLTEDGSEADQLPAMQSAALALASGRTNIMRNDAVKTIAQAAQVPIKRAIELVSGADINVGSRSSLPAKAWISDAQSQRIADLQYKMTNTVMTRNSKAAAQKEIDGIMGQASLTKSAAQGTEIIDPDLLKNAPRQTNTFYRSPGAGGSSLTPANYGSLPRNATLGRSMADANPLATVMTNVRNDPPNMVSMWNGGKRYLADFSSMPEVARSLKAMDNNGLSIVGRVAQVMNAPLRAGATTLSIPFQLRNAFFDAVDAYARAGIKPWGENGIIRGYVDAAKETPAYREWIAQGGGMSGFFAKQPTLGNLLKENVDPAKAAAQMESQIRASGGIEIKSPGDVARMAKQFGVDLATFAPLRRVGEVIEQGPRMAAYRQALGQGASPAAATMAGRRVTVDFSRMGSAMREINAIIPFSNAALQGTLNMARSVGVGQREGLMGTAANKATLTRYAALTTAVAGIYAWNRQFQDRYQDVPEYVRANSLVVMLPGGEKNPPGTPGWKSNPYVAMPLREIGALPYLITKGLEKADGQNPNFAAALGQAFQAASPVPNVMTPANLLGAPAKAIAEQQMGKGGWDTFRSRPIVSEKLQGLPAGSQATPQTSPTVIDMAHLANRSPLQGIVGEQSPERMERFIQDTTGGLGKTVLDAADTLGGKPSDTPPVVGGALTGIYKNYGGETEQRMYQQRDDAITQMDAQHRDLLETLAQNGATLGPPPPTIENIPLRPPEQAKYRELQLAYLESFFRDHPQINDRLAAIPNDTPQRVELRAKFLKDIVDSGNDLVRGRVLQSIGAEELRARLGAARSGADARNLYPQKDFVRVGA